MKEVLKNKRGVTLIETVAATAIIAIILISIVGALLYGQKMIVFTDTKNNAAAIGQDLVDKTIEKIESGTVPVSESLVVENHDVDVQVSGGTVSGKPVYYIDVRVYYNDRNASIDISGMGKFYHDADLDKGGDFV